MTAAMTAESYAWTEPETPLPDVPSEYEFAQLLQEEHSLEGWELVNDHEDAKVWKRKSQTHTGYEFKSQMELPSCSAEAVHEIVAQPHLRSQWDTGYAEFRVIKALDAETDITYTVMQAPFGVLKNRDFVDVRKQVVDKTDGTRMMIYRSTEDPEHPPRRGLVRARTLKSNWIIRPICQEADCTSQGVRVTYIGQADLVENIPEGLMNTIRAKSAVVWLKELKKCTQQHSEHTTQLQ